MDVGDRGEEEEGGREEVGQDLQAGPGGEEEGGAEAPAL